MPRPGADPPVFRWTRGRPAHGMDGSPRRRTPARAAEQGSAMSQSRLAFVVPLALIMGLALALRLWYVTTLPGQGKDLIFSDMATYDYTASQLVRGLPMTGGP